MAGLQYGDYYMGVVEAEHFDEVWPIVAPHLEPALEGTWGVISIEDLRIICKTNHSQLWAVTKNTYVQGAFVTKVQEGSNHKILDIEYLGGKDFNSWGIDLMRVFEENAKEQGVDIVRICGRKGWAKLFPSYKPQTYIIAKQL